MSKRVFANGFLVGFLLLFTAIIVFPWPRILDTEMSLMNMMAGPSLDHPLGTDHLGRDMFFNIVLAIRETVLPVWFAVILSTLLGYGSGYAVVAWSDSSVGSIFLNLTRYFGSIVMAIPIGIVVFMWASLVQKAGLFAVVSSLSVFFFLRSMFVIQSEYFLDRHLGYWIAHESLGGTLKERIWNYGFMRRWSDVLIENLMFHLGIAISIEAALSYLGFGVQPPAQSFGNILSAHYDQFLKGHWFQMLVIISALFLTFCLPRLFLKIYKQFNGLLSQGT